MKNSQGNNLEVGDQVYFANYYTIQVATVIELIDTASTCMVTLPDNSTLSVSSRSLALKSKFVWPNRKHESHKNLRSSDASTFDFVCSDCGATDRLTDWGNLKKPCAATQRKLYDEDGYIIWHGGDRPVDPTTIVDVKIRSGLPRSPVKAGLWPQICWQHRSTNDPKNEWDIVAYKVVT